MTITHSNQNDDCLLFNEELIDETSPTLSTATPWIIMVVDDDEGVHQITRLVLQNYLFRGQETRLLHASSAEEGLALLQQNPSTALIILDVIMESDSAGLDLVKAIREDLKNTGIRILLRTGQAGMYNELQIAMDYDINEYIEKSNLTSDKLLASVTTLLKAYTDHQTLLRQQQILETNIAQLSDMAIIFDESVIATLVLDTNLKVTHANSAFVKLTGFEFTGVRGEKPFFLNSDKNDQVLLRAAWVNLLDSGSWEGELWCITQEGKDMNIQLSASLLERSGQNFSGIAIQFSNITQLREKEQKLLLMATQDPLTTLPNRNLLFYRLDTAIRDAKRSNKSFALLFVDLDYFKNINDTLGHKYGDLLLKQVSERLRLCIRESDTIARVGGDEFVALIGNYDAKNSIELVAKKINNTLSLPFDLGDQKGQIAGSVGISIYPDHAMTSEKLYHYADLAMYQAKHNGRGTYCIYSDNLQIINSRTKIGCSPGDSKS